MHGDRIASATFSWPAVCGVQQMPRSCPFHILSQSSNPQHRDMPKLALAWCARHSLHLSISVGARQSALSLCSSPAVTLLAPHESFSSSTPLRQVLPVFILGGVGPTRSPPARRKPEQVAYARKPHTSMKSHLRTAMIVTWSASRLSCSRRRSVC